MKSQRDFERERLNKISEKIIKCAYKVHNTLGCGFLEKVYYENAVVGDYTADILVEKEVIVELKTKKVIDDIDKAQLLNYLNATKLKLGLILNFGMPKLQIKRLVYGF